MSLRELVVMYVLVGGVLAVLRQRCGPRHTLGERLAEAALLTLLWPLYGPFLLASGGPRARRATADGEETPAERALLGALQRAHGAGMGDLLPDAEAVARLREGLRLAEARLVDMDELPQRPEFSEPEAQRRCAELTADGAAPAAAAAAGRLEHIRRLAGLREAERQRLREIEELLRQLQVQVEMVRLAGRPGADAREGVATLVARLEGLDLLLKERQYI